MSFFRTKIIIISCQQIITEFLEFWEKLKPFKEIQGKKIYTWNFDLEVNFRTLADRPTSVSDQTCETI